MLGIGVNLKLLRHCFTELVLRQHALNGQLEDPLRLLSNHLLCSGLSQTAGVQSVMAIEFLFDLVSLQNCLASIDHYNVISSIEKRSPLRTALTAQDQSNLRREMANRLAARINHVPFSSSSEFLTAGEVCRHS